MGSRFIKKFISLLLIVVLAISCGASPEEEIKSNLVSAEILLSTSKCQDAIDLLEGMGRQNTNARYLKLLASAYACRSNYSTIVFFADDIGLTGNPDPMGGMSTYSTSLVNFTSPLQDDLKFKDLQTAIDILLYAGGISRSTNPTSIVRSAYFTERDAGDINAEMAYMMMVQLGRFFKVYANTSAAGVKGAGAGANVCFTDYPTIDGVADPGDIPLELALAGQAGACKVKNSPHSQLDSGSVSASVRRARLCQGIVLLNGILDVLPAVIVAAGGGELGDVSGVLTDIEGFKTIATTAYPDIANVLTVISQNNCETSASISIDMIEAYYATLFEALIN